MDDEHVREPDKDGWSCLLQDVRSRGGKEADLVVIDGHEGILAALGTFFPVTPRQRCLVQKQRTILNAIPHRERSVVAAELSGIFKQEAKEELGFSSSSDRNGTQGACA